MTTANAQCTDLSNVQGAGGVVWSVSPDGLHTNLVVLAPGGSIASHRNDHLDVLIVVLAGSGTALVDADEIPLDPMVALVVPKGTVRSVVAGDEGLRYLTIHARRGPMTIGDKASDRV
jgi:quercetin dioxygenase-like cupin family protein